MPAFFEGGGGGAAHLFDRPDRQLCSDSGRFFGTQIVCLVDLVIKAVQHKIQKVGDNGLRAFGFQKLYELARFIEKFPQVSLSLFSGNSSEVEKALQEHRIDLALVEGNTRQPNLKYTPFLQDELVAIVHTRSKWMDYDEITLDELKEVPLVLRERGSGTLDVLITALHKHNIKLSDLTIRMHLGSTESIKLFLENSECMGILSIRSINKELYSGKFKVLDIKDLVMFREFDFVQLQGQDTGLPALFMQFANHYKEKL